MQTKYTTKCVLYEENNWGLKMSAIKIGQTIVIVYVNDLNRGITNKEIFCCCYEFVNNGTPTYVNNKEINFN